MIFVKGDLLKLAEQGHFDVIVHGCNCMLTMGTGIAKQIKEKYPQAYQSDLDFDRVGMDKLGHYSTAPSNLPNRKFLIVNAYTQLDYTRAGEVAVDRFNYDAFERILVNLGTWYGDQRFGFPLIGMGLAGGDKIRIFELLQAFEDDVMSQGGTSTVVIL